MKRGMKYYLASSGDCGMTADEAKSESGSAWVMAEDYDVLKEERDAAQANFEREENENGQLRDEREKLRKELDHWTRKAAIQECRAEKAEARLKEGGPDG